MLTPMPKLSAHHIHRGIIGINAFVLLCGIKAFQLLNMQAPGLKKPRTQWSVEETHLMLDLLIAQSSRIGQSASFPQVVYAEVAKSLGTNKTGPMVASKFQALKRIFRAIETYRGSSGTNTFDQELGANVQTAAEVDQWNSYMTSNDAKDLASFRNRGWPFLEKMAKLCPSGTIATGTYSLAPTEAVSVNQVVYDLDDNNLEYEPTGMSTNNFEFPSDINTESLLQLGHDLGSPNPFIQSSALDSAISMYSQISPNAFDNVRLLYDQGIPSPTALHSFSPLQHVPHPVTPAAQSSSSANNSSNRTPPELPSSSYVASCVHPSSSHASSLVSSARIKKSKSRGRTPAVSTSSSVSSRAGSKRSAKASQASSNISTPLAIHSMAGAILRVGDNFNRGLERIVPSIATPSQAEPSTVPRPQASDDVRRIATSMVKTDDRLTIAIRGKLASAFLSDTSLAASYIELADTPDVREVFVAEWCKKMYGDSTVAVQPAGTSESASLPDQSAAGPSFSNQSKTMSSKSSPFYNTFDTSASPDGIFSFDSECV